jgi:hypothetical protein
VVSGRLHGAISSLIAKAMAEPPPKFWIILVEDPETPLDRRAHGPLELMDAMALADILRAEFDSHELSNVKLSLIRLLDPDQA